MHRFLFSSLGLMATVVSAAHLFVASQNNTVTTLEFVKEPNGTFRLFPVSTSAECGASPTWLVKDAAENILYCVDENNAGGPGHITSFSIGGNSSLTRLGQSKTGTGPVFSQRYGNGGQGIAVAEFGQGALSTWRVSNTNGSFALVQNITFPALSAPGPVKDRQTQSHAHQAILDPTGGFILVPDLGADKIRTFAVDNDSLRLTNEKDFDVPPGSGPRHGAFTDDSCGTTRLYIVNELNAKIYTFNVTYPAAGRIQLDKIAETFTHGNFSAPKNAPGEIEISSDQRFLTISNRLTGDINITNPNPTAGQPAKIQGDSLSTFIINPKDGSLRFIGATSSGGISPRQFRTNRAGTYVAVANFQSQNVAIFRRDTVTGILGREPVASHFVAGLNQLVAAVIWND